jgi:hypothetical protein
MDPGNLTGATRGRFSRGWVQQNISGINPTAEMDNRSGRRRPAMAKSLTIEEESGVITGTRHQHNGYYAGDFTEVPFRELQMTTFHTAVHAATHGEIFGRS